MTTNNSDAQVLFDDVPAWASTGTTPAQSLAQDLADTGHVISDADSGDALDVPDEWGWLGAAETDEPLRNDGGVDDADVDEAVVQEPSDLTFPARRRDSGAGRTRVVLGACALLGVVVAGAVAAGSVVGGATDEPAPSDPVAALNARSTPAAPVDECPESVDGAVTTGNDAGSQRSGAEVIKAFDYSYYVRRSGAAARAMATPTGVGTIEQLQTSINQIPQQTRHCLSITDRGNGLYAVRLTESPPEGGAPLVYRQLIQTVAAGGKTWIASITKDG